MPLNFLCLASYHKGNRFLQRLKEEGCGVYLLTVANLLGEPWPRQYLDDVLAVPTFRDRRGLINAVAYLMRTLRIDQIVALDDFDVEVAAFLREHFRMTHTGHGESTARLFRDKLAMRTAASSLQIRIPDFCPIFHHHEVSEFLARKPAPWLIKPRGEASAAGIRVCHTPDDVWRRIHELGDDQSFALIEQMVPGDLYHVDSLCADGKVIFAEVNGYRKPLLDVYHGGGIYATRTMPREHPIVLRLISANAAVLEGFGLGWGASHTEFMHAHADGEIYFIETSARVGGASTAEMVEHATGINLWSEWAKLEICRNRTSYLHPPRQQRYAGVVNSLSRDERPDTSGFDAPEIVHRLEMKHHIGFVLASGSYERVEQLQTDYIARIARDFHAVLPAADRVSH